MSSSLLRLFSSLALVLLLSGGYAGTGWAQTSTAGVVITVEVPEPTATVDGSPSSSRAESVDDGLFLGSSAEPWLSALMFLVIGGVGAFALGSYRSMRSFRTMKKTLQSIEKLLNQNIEV